MVNFEYYKVFYYACLYKNFSKAAEVLNTSQSAVSHTMQNLENNLDCRLFTRSNHGILLTAEGEKLYEYVSRAFENFEQGENEISSMNSADGGVVRIATTETALHSFLFDSLTAFHSEYPKIKFKMDNLGTLEAIGAVRSGDADFAIIVNSQKTEAPLSSKKLLKVREILLAGKYYMKLAKDERSFEDLINVPYIGIDHTAATGLFFDEYFKSLGIKKKPDIEIATADMIQPMIENNFGIGFVPEKMIDYSKIGKSLWVIKLKQNPPERYVQLVRNTSLPYSSAAKIFYKFMVPAKEIE